MASDPDTPAVLSHPAPGLPPLDVSRTDDPAVLAEAAREDYSLHVVPQPWRLSAPKMALAWSALMSAMFWVVVAAGASLVVGTVQALVGLAVAALVHGSLCLVMSRTAADSGQTVGLFSRRGRAGDVAFEFRPGRVPRVDVGGVVAWVVASGVGITLIATGSALASTWALVITFVLAVVIAAVGKVLRNGSVAGRANDPRDDVEDVWADRIRCHVCHRSYVAVELDRDPAHGDEAICAACATSSTFLDAVAAGRR